MALLLSVLQDRIHSTNAWGEGDLLVSNGKNDGCWPNEFGPTTTIYRLDQGKSQIFNPLALINPAMIFYPRFAALNAGYDLILIPRPSALGPWPFFPQYRRVEFIRPMLEERGTSLFPMVIMMAVGRMNSALQR